VLKAKLEHLLEVYPPEDIESRRFEKIAAALGNRTVKQVKEFILQNVHLCIAMFSMV